MSLSFRTYVEARYGNAGGAFGKSAGAGFDFSKRSAADNLDMRSMGNRDANKFQDLNARVKTGKVMEEKIIDALKAAGWNIEPPKRSQDMNDKIDAWVNRSGKWLPMQIKYRDSGDEIAMETMWSWSPERFEVSPLRFDGRDMVGKAKIYCCLNKSGTMVRVCDADEAKNAAKEACNKLAHAYLVSGAKVAGTSKAEARITGDPASGRGKVMSFVKPDALISNQNIPVGGEKGLWAAA